MKKILLLGLLAITIFIPPQDSLGQNVDFIETVVMYPQKYTVSLREGWEVQYRKAIGKTEISDGNAVIGLFTEEGVLNRIMEIDETISTGDVLVELFPDFFDDRRITREDVRPFDYNGKSGHIYLELENQIAGVMRLEDATFVLIRVDIDDEFTDEQLTDIYAILGSVTAGNDVRAVRDPSMASLGEPCFVSSPEGANVSLRVGPGFNRWAIAFMGPDQYKVYGQIRTNDGVIWYKLDPFQAVPEKDANEIWVEARDVLREGDCDLVADASAPPILEAGQYVPPRVPGISIPSNAGVRPTEGSIIPAEGTFTLFYGEVGSSNCTGEGSESFKFDRSLLEPISGALIVRNEGAVFAFADILFIRESSGDYVGTISFANGVVEYIRVRPTNPNYLSGARTQNTGLDTGQQCSISVPVTIAR